jgi:hypothetical protein
MANAKQQYAKQAKLAADKNKKEIERVNKIVNEKIFPLLKEISDDVEDAKMIPGVLKTVVQQAIFNEMMKRKIKDLNLINQLKGGQKELVEKYAKLITLLENEPISVAYTILDGLVEEIMLKEKLAMKKLSLQALFNE